MSSVMRLSYVLGWVFAALAVVLKALDAAGVQAISRMPVTPRGTLFFAGFLFLATIATSVFEQATASGGKTRSTAA